MSQSVVSRAVVYPCSDGQPMGESDLHIDCITHLRDALRRHFEKRAQGEVYVAGNMFVYYEEGNPRAVVAPDVFVVFGAPVHSRDSYLLWKEPKGPDFVLEVTSASTRREDEGRKREVYAMLKVGEYFLYDPRGEYLAPPLQGFRLRAGEYRALPAVTVLPGGGMALRSEVLGLDLRDRREERMLRLHDPVTGQDLFTYREAERKREEESAARQEAEARIAKLEARLRDFERAATAQKAKRS